MPEGGRAIDGRGKTLVPGLWDAHKHFGDGYDLLANVATGMTSIRSPGNGLDKLVWARDARAAGNLLAPEVFGAIIIDQQHPLSAQGADLVSSEAETIEAVREAADAGLWGVKFYTSMNPEWIAPGAAEAHRLGLNVLGHVPATMRPLEAVRAGYDEVTHLNFIIMQDLPQSVVDVSNTAARFEGPAQYAKDVDLDGPVMQRVHRRTEAARHLGRSHHHDLRRLFHHRRAQAGAGLSSRMQERCRRCSNAASTGAAIRCSADVTREDFISEL